jgi:hypothetical protein
MRAANAKKRAYFQFRNRGEPGFAAPAQAPNDVSSCAVIS